MIVILVCFSFFLCGFAPLREALSSFSTAEAQSRHPRVTVIVILVCFSFFLCGFAPLREALYSFSTAA